MTERKAAAPEVRAIRNAKFLKIKLGVKPDEVLSAKRFRAVSSSSEDDLEAYNCFDVEETNTCLRPNREQRKWSRHLSDIEPMDSAIEQRRRKHNHSRRRNSLSGQSKPAKPVPHAKKRRETTQLENSQEGPNSDFDSVAPLSSRQAVKKNQLTPATTDTHTPSISHTRKPSAAPPREPARIPARVHHPAISSLDSDSEGEQAQAKVSRSTRVPAPAIEGEITSIKDGP